MSNIFRANKASAGGGGTEVYLNGVKQDVSRCNISDFEGFLDWVPLPYTFRRGSAVLLNGEIHLMGSSNGNSSSHYKWNGSDWTHDFTLAQNFVSAVVSNNDLYGLGTHAGGGDTFNRFYKWNGSSWTQLTNCPIEPWYNQVVVLNNEIHVLGSSSMSLAPRGHYKWNGSSWIQVSTLPYDFISGTAIVLNNEIHILGSNISGDEKKHYKWNGSSWTQVSTLPYEFSKGSAVVLSGEIHIFGTISSLDNAVKHYKWNGSSWTQVSTLPHAFSNGAALVKDSKMYLFGGYTSINSIVVDTQLQSFIYDETFNYELIP